MTLRHILCLVPLCLAMIVGCGGEGDNKIIEPVAEISPSEAQSQTEEYQEAMNNMPN